MLGGLFKSIGGGRSLVIKRDDELSSLNFCIFFGKASAIPRTQESSNQMFLGYSDYGPHPDS